MSAQAVYNRLAQTAAAEAAKSPGMEGAANPGPFIQFLQQLFAQLLPMLLACIPKAADAAAAAQAPSFWQRFSLKLHIRGEMPDRASYVQYGDALYTSMLAAGKTVTEQDMVDVAAG
jgi:hypothetical protein